VRNGSRRGLARRKTRRTFARVGPVPQSCFFGSAIARLVSPCRPREGADEGEGAWTFVTSERSTRSDAARGGARASSYCRSRQNALGLREARDRYRSGRKPARYTERVNGSLTTGGAQARKRRSPPLAKGGRSTLARRSSSRERRAFVEATWFRSCFGASGMRVATDDGRHPGSGMRTPFTRPPRNRSWRPPGHSVGFPPQTGAPARARRRRQGCQRRTESTRTRGKRTPSDASDRAPKWEARREARFSPVSFASGGPEPPFACFSRLRTGEAAREEDVRVVGHGAARLRDESNPRAGAERPRAGQRCCAGKRRSTSARVGTVSECRSRSDAPPVATPAGATKRTTDTRDLARRNHRG